MRKKVLGMIAFVAISAMVGYNGYTAQNNNEKLSDLALVNVEALAANSEIVIPYICAGSTPACYDSYYHEVFDGYRIY